MVHSAPWGVPATDGATVTKPRIMAPTAPKNTSLLIMSPPLDHRWERSGAPGRPRPRPTRGGGERDEHHRSACMALPLLPRFVCLKRKRHGKSGDIGSCPDCAACL